MSRAYRIGVTESLTRHVEVEDGICTTLELLQILPPERTREILAAELAKIGFEPDESGKKVVRTDGDGMVVSVELATGEVKVSLAGAEEVTVEATRTATLGDQANRAQAEERLRDTAKKDLEVEVADRKEALRRKVTEKLEKKLRDLKQELDRAGTRVTAESLKERAAQLGEIQEISEDQQSGSLTIRVKV